MSENLNSISLDVRKKIISSLVPLVSHHIGSSLSIVEILVYLYFQEMNIFPKDPKNKTRDIFILSKGHGALALYCVLNLKGFFSSDFLSTYDKNGGLIPEHASVFAPGVELSTGSLGHGLPVGLGFSVSLLGENNSRRVFVLMSDGELNEGSNWESIMFAGCHGLRNLTVIVDVNKFQGYGDTKKILDLEPLDKKLKDFNWNTYRVDGHNFSEIESVFIKIKNSKNNNPNIIFTDTIKGKGVPTLEGRFESHYKSLDEDIIKDVKLFLEGQKL